MKKKIEIYETHMAYTLKKPNLRSHRELGKEILHDTV